jgi:Ser/Thr protein kinase RdoA (MazF antagonist)
MLMGRALRTVHGIAVEGFGSPQPSGGWSTPSWRAALRQDHLFVRRIVDAVFTPQESAAIEATTLGDPQLEIARPHLIHGDVGPVNGLFQVENGAVALAGIIDPGGTVGGDPMFDLAGGTNDRDAYARGIWEGYTEGYALTPAEEYRYRRLLLLSYYWTACWQYQTGRDFDERKAWALEALHAL